MPPGSDPADLARSDPEALREAVAAARPFLAFRVERALGGGRPRIGRRGGPRRRGGAWRWSAEHPNEFVRDQYVMQVAQRTGIEPERLRERLRRAVRPAPGDERSGHPPDRAHAVGKPHRAEEEALRLAIHRPEEVADRLR